MSMERGRRAGGGSEAVATIAPPIAAAGPDVAVPAAPAVAAVPQPAASSPEIPSRDAVKPTVGRSAKSPSPLASESMETPPAPPADAVEPDPDVLVPARRPPEAKVAARSPRPEATVGTVRVTGATARVTLVGESGNVVYPGDVEPGNYRVLVKFPGKEEVPGVTVFVRARQTVTLDCREAFQICRVKK